MPTGDGCARALDGALFCERRGRGAAVQGVKVRGDGGWPALDAWFNEMETRPTYLGIKSGQTPVDSRVAAPSAHHGCWPPPQGAERQWRQIWRQGIIPLSLLSLHASRMQRQRVCSHCASEWRMLF